MDTDHASFNGRFRRIDLNGMVRVAVLGLDKVSFDGPMARQIPFAADALGVLRVDFVFGVGVLFRQSPLALLSLVSFAKFDSSFV